MCELKYQILLKFDCLTINTNLWNWQGKYLVNLGKFSTILPHKNSYAFLFFYLSMLLTWAKGKGKNTWDLGGGWILYLTFESFLIVYDIKFESLGGRFSKFEFVFKKLLCMC